VGGRAGVDAELLGTGLFGAEVFPDLPIATTWDGLYRAMLKWVPLTFAQVDTGGVWLVPAIL